jgi:hypothetical protein
MDEMLAQARSSAVGLTLATQHLSQLDAELRQAVLANPRSRLAFQVAGSDARTLAADFGLGLEPADFSGLGAFEAVAQLHAAGRTQPACTFTTRPPSEPVTDPAEVRALSRQRFGADGTAVDEAISSRLEGGHNREKDGQVRPTGRKRRDA